MKNIYILFTLILLSGCGASNYLTLSVTEPAPITMPAHVKSIGVVNRNVVASGNTAIDNIDKILSMEGMKLDKEGGERSVEALLTELNRNSRFTAVKNLSQEKVEAGAPKVFPAAVTWEQVNMICSRNKVDALYILEFYDTDAKATYTTAPVSIKGPLGIDIPAIEHHVALNTQIRTGWRIYDNIGKQIIDEYTTTRNTTAAGKGINPMNAVTAVKGRKEAVLSISSDIGSNYAQEILPYQTRVRRDYYVKGTNNFEIGKRKAQTGKWDEASTYWKKEINNPKAKIAGRACYNMAIIHEINGELDKAISWASDAYEKYNNKSALHYIKLLRYRQNRIEELKMQQMMVEEEE